jgi:hypothetical protein
MDTRFWGPSAWRLLHLIAFSEHRNPDVFIFLEELPYILPCRFCRSSLTEFYKHRPVDRDDLGHWMYEIHNDVNNKLRKQGHLRNPNPSFSEVKKQYTELLLETSDKHMLGFDFFKSVAFVTRNLEKSHLKRWWASIGGALPFPEWRTQWQTAVKEIGTAPVHKGRTAVLAWLYKICNKMNVNPSTNFKDYCKEARIFSSSCPKKKGTCRSVKTRKRETLKKRRAIILKQFGGFF